MSNQEKFNDWWSRFQFEHEEWPRVDREALLLAAYNARQPEIDQLQTFLQALEALYRKKVDDCAELEVELHREVKILRLENQQLREAVAATYQKRRLK